VIFRCLHVRFVRISAIRVASCGYVGSRANLSTCCSVDHGPQLSDSLHIPPAARLASEVQVGDRSWIGIGASVFQQIRICADVTFGAAAAVVRDLPDGFTAVGVPALVLPTA
jgi:acetyltransferase-like isoleucine patch superfamily enzyme